MNKINIKVAIFDFRGVIVNHNNYTDIIPGIEELLKKLKFNGVFLAIVSSFPVDAIKELIGDLKIYFEDNIYSGRGKEKLDKIIELAQRIRVDMSDIAFIDDKPANLEPVKTNSNVYVIGFRGSGKYYPNILDSCKKLKIPFADDIKNLEELLLTKRRNN